MVFRGSRDSEGVAISGESFVTNNDIHTDMSITTFHLYVTQGLSSKLHIV